MPTHPLQRFNCWTNDCVLRFFHFKTLYYLLIITSNYSRLHYPIKFSEVNDDSAIKSFFFSSALGCKWILKIVFTVNVYISLTRDITGKYFWVLGDYIAALWRGCRYLKSKCKSAAVISAVLSILHSNNNLVTSNIYFSETLAVSPAFEFSSVSPGGWNAGTSNKSVC